MKKLLVVTSIFLFLNTLLTGCDFIVNIFSPTSPPSNETISTRIVAAEVLDFNGISCGSKNDYCDTSEILGMPNETYPWSGHFLSLGSKPGFVSVMMGDIFTNGPDTDIRVFEVGNLQGGGDEAFDVFISEDGLNWIQVADNIQNDPGEAFTSIDISPNSGNYQYVKLADESTSTSSRSPGSDIDAIEALWGRQN